MILRARIVLPMRGQAIRDGIIEVAGSRIIRVGKWGDLGASDRRQAVDLGENALLPGLVNAHCHLDYTNMAGQFPPPKVFTDWLRLITTAKSHWTIEDYADSWANGAQMLLRTGATTVADIEAVPELLPRMWRETPLRLFSFLEMIALTNRRKPEAVLRESVEKIQALRGTRFTMGLSPHAPYTTLPELLRLNARIARKRRWRITTHLAESALEYEMFRRAKGEMFSWLRRSGRDMSDCGKVSPTQHLDRCGLLAPNLLAAHANYLAPGDAALLAKRKVSIVHCPRSHSYFRHGSFPLRRLARAGVNLCLGTDSLASVYKARRHTIELNMFEEMRALAAREPTLPARDILRMATLNGALALGLQGRVGELSPGAFADIIAVPFAGKLAEAYDTLLQHAGDVTASLIHGKWAIPPE
jgi:cytosine/adenosine deaminase-related metal-dependent hydrolase